MDLGQLRYFNKIVKHRSFTRAAHACSVSQPALSQQIAKLEKELGQPLFERHGRIIKLTRAGQILQNKADKILSLVDDAKRQIMDDGEHGRIIVSAIPTVAPFLLPRIIQEVSTQFPAANVECNEVAASDLLKLCVDGEIDIGLTSIISSFKHLTFEPLLTEELLIALAPNHPLVAKPKITYRDIAGERLVLLSGFHCLREVIESFSATHNFQLIVAAKAEQLETVKQLVAKGCGLSFVPRMAAEADTTRMVVYRSLSGSKPIRKIAICYQSHRFQSQLISNFLKAMRECLDNGTVDWYESNAAHSEPIDDSLESLPTNPSATKTGTDQS
jgi:LysR family hydrogen peroxide-inducible transcriptional activator